MGRVATSGTLVRQLGSLFEGGSVAGLSDRQLLERYIALGRDPAGEAAFAALVDRHGPMVLGVCRQLLGDAQHAEDAFQAVYLVLARKARSVRDPDLLGNWLYGVATRTARCSRRQIARRREREDGVVMDRHGLDSLPPADRPTIDRDQAEAVHLEVGRLPRAFRQPVVLCYFEGLTLDEAARRLRCPAGTLRSRLARAREKLRRGLSRRGVALSGTALAAALASRSVSASVSPLLCDTTTEAATVFAARHAAGGALSASATTLAREVLRTMLLHKLRFAAFPLLLLATVAAGAGYLARPSAMGEEPGSPPAARSSSRPDEAGPHPAPGRMTVVGRVLDPQGKEVPGAMVMVYGAIKQGGRTDRPGAMAPEAMGQEASDGSGHFRLDAPRLSSSTHHESGAAAIAPGYGVGWVGLDLDADRPAVDITLRPEQVIQGRLFDLHGRPAQGVRVSVEGMGPPSRSPDALPIQIEGPDFWGEDGAIELPAWPRPSVTDADGRFLVRGVGRDLRVLLMADDPRFARERIVVDTDGGPGPTAVTMALEPAKIIHGRVTYADTGKPVPCAAIEVVAYRGGPGYTSRFQTDDEGRFCANPFSTERYALAVYAPEGQPYLNAWERRFDWKKGALEHRVDFVLSRGTLIRGKVTEEGSGRPVAGAMLCHFGRPVGTETSGAWNGHTQTGPDGSYQVAALPREGTLVVLGPSEDYVLRESSDRTIRQGMPGGRRWYAHAFIDCDLRSGESTREVDIVLRRGKIARARIIGPDGQPVREARVLSRAVLEPSPSPWRSWWGQFHGDVRDGRWELHGLADDADIPVHFLEPRVRLGATARLSGWAAGEGPMTIRLEPCGRAVARLVDPAGNPLAGYRDPYLASMVVTPGPAQFSRDKADEGRPAADQDYLSRIDPINYPEDLATDGRGRLTLPALIPGATYRIYDRSRMQDDLGPLLRKEFVARAGEVIELGDVVIEKPEVPE